MSVRIRMKKMGRTHRPFFRICAIDKRAPRDGRALEELGTYNPSISDTNARAILKRDRIDYWLGVGAQPSEKVAVLIKKYGTGGTHLDEQRAALERLAMAPEIADPEGEAKLPEPETPPAEPAAEGESSEAPAAEAPTEPAATEEAAATEEKTEENKSEDTSAEAAPEQPAAEENPEETPEETPEEKPAEG